MSDPTLPRDGTDFELKLTHCDISREVGYEGTNAYDASAGTFSPDCFFM
jgi:hypothetical protein